MCFALVRRTTWWSRSMRIRPRLALARGSARFRMHDEHQSGRALDPRTGSHALGCRDGPEGRRTAEPRAERDVARGNYAILSAKATLFLQSALRARIGMDAIRGTVVVVACDAGHRFSKPRRELIHLIAGHGVEGDAHAGPHVRHRYLARR